LCVLLDERSCAGIREGCHASDRVELSGSVLFDVVATRASRGRAELTQTASCLDRPLFSKLRTPKSPFPFSHLASGRSCLCACRQLSLVYRASSRVWLARLAVELTSSPLSRPLARSPHASSMITLLHAGTTHLPLASLRCCTLTLSFALPGPVSYVAAIAAFLFVTLSYVQSSPVPFPAVHPSVSSSNDLLIPPLCTCTYSLASGLLWVAEVIEEHSKLAKKVGRNAIFVSSPRFPLLPRVRIHADLTYGMARV
jgi:hypothetical protein